MTDKLGMDIFYKLEPVFRSEVSNVFFTEICGNYQDNNFQIQIYFNIINFNLEKPRKLKNPGDLPVGFLNPSTNPSKNPRFF